MAQGCLAFNMSYGTEVKLVGSLLLCDIRATSPITLKTNDNIYSSISLLDPVSDCKQSLLCGSQDVCNISLSEFETESTERVFKSKLPLKISHGHDLSLPRLKDVEDSQSNGSDSRSLIRMADVRVGYRVR